MAETNTPSAWDELALESYVLLTTTRRSGVAVPTPVWVARDGDSLVVTTGAESGKVKRIRHTPRVTLQACDRTGKPNAGSLPIEAHATVHDDAASRERLEGALSSKYGVQYAAIRAMSKLRGRNAAASIVVRLTALA